MKGWNSSHIERLKNRGMVVTVSTTIEKHDTDLLKKVKREMRHDESDLQINCFKTFRLIYPKIRHRFFAIPNGSYRTAIGAALLNAEGCTPGVLDSFLAIPRKEYSGMWVEFKTQIGRLSDYQKLFIKEMSQDYKCVVCRSVEEFLKEIKEYLL